MCAAMSPKEQNTKNDSSRILYTRTCFFTIGNNWKKIFFGCLLWMTTCLIIDILFLSIAWSRMYTQQRSSDISYNVPNAVTLHTMGDRRVRGKSMTKWTNWREYHREAPANQGILPRSSIDTPPCDNKAYHDCLHLTDPLRVNCLMKVVKYFYHNT